MMRTISEMKATVLAACALGLLLTPPAWADEAETTTEPTTEVVEESTDDTYDGLIEVDKSKADIAYIDPDADFSGYKRVMILDAHVAFVKNWRRDQNRMSSRSNVSNADMERIRSEVANLFKEVFVEVLAADDGYEIATETGDDVLLIRPAILDLDVTAPDTMSAGRGRTYAASTGAATFYIELFDSVSGAIMGRAADRKEARRNGSRLSWSNSVMNRQDGRRLFTRWATQLRSFLDQHYVGAGKTDTVE